MIYRTKNSPIGLYWLRVSPSQTFSSLTGRPK